jgi:hydrogenase nickel incorporation protein HypA/HybF
MAGELMGAVLSSIEGRTDISRVEEVNVTIGRLSMLGEEQLRFCWEAIIEEEPLLKGSLLVIAHEEGRVRCRSCGFEGPIDMTEDPLLHPMLPVFACPKCSCGVDITSGRSIHVNNIKALSAEGAGE